MEKPLKKQQKVSLKLKLKQHFDKDDYDGIQNTIQINKRATKKTLQ